MVSVVINVLKKQFLHFSLSFHFKIAALIIIIIIIILTVVRFSKDEFSFAH